MPSRQSLPLRHPSVQLSELCFCCTHRPLKLAVFARDLLNVSAGTYVYEMPPTIHDAVPDVVVEGSPAPVIIRGANFVNTSTLACRFGRTSVNATFLTNSTLLCVAPAYPVSEHNALKPESFIATGTLLIQPIPLQVDDMPLSQ